jgi:hypothetical protein
MKKLEKEMFELEQELDIPSSMRWHNSKPKQSTLEEAAEKYYPPYTNGIITDEIRALREGFVKGYEVQAERMFSKEEVNEIISAVWISCEDNEGKTFTEVRRRILEQFKKK